MKSPKILKPETKKEDMNFVGVQVPQQVHVFLNKYALAKQMNRSTLIRTLLEDWIKRQGEHADEELIDEIIRKAKHQWKLQKQNSNDAVLFIFKRKLQKELESKQISSEDITKILNSIT